MWMRCAYDGCTARIEPAPDRIVPTLGAACSSPLKPAVATGSAASTPCCAATPRETRTAAGYEPTGPCQSSGTLRTAPPVIVRNECPMKSSIAASSATATASVTTRTNVRAGPRPLRFRPWLDSLGCKMLQHAMVQLFGAEHLLDRRNRPGVSEGVREVPTRSP